MSITEFLKARIAEDEAAAKWSKVLPESNAKRAIIAEVVGWRHDYNDEDMWYSCPLAIAPDDTEPGSGYTGDDEGVCRCGLELRQLAILAPLAAVYKDHPDYEEPKL